MVGKGLNLTLSHTSTLQYSYVLLLVTLYINIPGWKCHEELSYSYTDQHGCHLIFLLL